MSGGMGPQELLDAGRDTGVYAHAQASVWHHGQVLFEGAATGTSRALCFDLASVTKIGTTCAFLALRARGVLGPGTRLGALLSNVAAPDLTLEDLLFHRSGLPAWRPFFAAPEAMPAIIARGGGAEAFSRSREAVLAAVRGTPAEAPVATRAVYSDVGFILLGEALAAAAGMPLEQVFRECVAEPLGLPLDYRRLTTLGERRAPGMADDDRAAEATGLDAGGFAITGTQRPRPPAPGQEGLFDVAPIGDRAGEVDDDNAWAMAGIAGHAGLFGTGAQLGRLGQAILEELDGAGRLAPAELWAHVRTRDPLTPGSERTLGFDTASPAGSSGGRFMSPQAIGHLGFTGTSLWIDPARALVVALVTNRTWRGRDPRAIRAFRPHFHDCVAAQLPSPSATT